MKFNLYGWLRDKKIKAQLTSRARMTLLKQVKGKKFTLRRKERQLAG
jgi:hypothetical protein